MAGLTGYGARRPQVTQCLAHIPSLPSPAPSLTPAVPAAGLPREVRKHFPDGTASVYESASKAMGDEAALPGGGWDRFLKWSGAWDVEWE